MIDSLPIGAEGSRVAGDCRYPETTFERAIHTGNRVKCSSHVAPSNFDAKAFIKSSGANPLGYFSFAVYLAYGYSLMVAVGPTGCRKDAESRHH